MPDSGAIPELGTAPRRWVRPPHVLVKQVGQSFIALNLRTEMYHTLNASAMRMWDVLLETPTDDAAIQILAQEFDVTVETLKRDFRVVVTELADLGFVERIGAQP